MRGGEVTFSSRLSNMIFGFRCSNVIYTGPLNLNAKRLLHKSQAGTMLINSLTPIDTAERRNKYENTN